VTLSWSSHDFVTGHLEVPTTEHSASIMGRFHSTQFLDKSIVTHSAGIFITVFIKQYKWTLS